jgi:hypothetical protein
MRFPHLLLALSCAFLLAAGPGAAAPVLEDQDGDGAFDTATVGDWDDDGLRETADVQAAVDALTDSGAKTVRVTPGVYAPPAVAPPGPGLIQLPSRTTLACEQGVRLEGLAPPPAGSDTDTATVTNRDHESGNTDVQILGCEITGGMPASYDSSPWQALTRMGVYLHTVTRGRVENAYVHDTLHSCLYAKNSRDLVWKNNLLDDCGGYNDLVRNGKPAIYLYATTGGTVRDVTVLGNIVRRAGANALNLRRNTVGDVMRDVTFAGNRVEDTADATDCVTVRGAQDVTIVDQVCVRTGPVGTGPGATAYLNDSPSHVAAVQNLTVERLRMYETRGPGVAIHAYAEGVTLRDVSIEETSQFNACVDLEPPFRRVWIERLTAERCGGHGIFQRGCAACGVAGDGLVLRDVTIAGTDVWHPLDSIRAAGIAFSGPVSHLSLEGADISGVSGSGIDFGANRVVASSLRDVAVDGVQSGFLGRMQAAALPVCSEANAERWAVVSDAASPATCSGGGSSQVVCRCSELAWRMVPVPRERYGVHLHNSATRDVRLESIEATNFAGSYGIRVDGSPNAVEIVAPRAVDSSPATPLPMQGAVDASSAATGLAVSGATCAGTDPGTPCVRTSNAYPVPEDPDGDGIATACDHQCSDGVDNDGDQKVDFPLDPGCKNEADPYEKHCGASAELALLAPAVLLGHRRLRRRDRG